MKRIIIDTNFLLIPYVFGVDIFSEIERIADFPYTLCIMEGTVEELERIVRDQTGKDKAAASFALQILKQKSLYMLKNSSEDSVDDAILKVSDRDTIVATQDRGLIQRLKLNDIKTINLRNKKYLVLR